MLKSILPRELSKVAYYRLNSCLLKPNDISPFENLKSTDQLFNTETYGENLANEFKSMLNICDVDFV